MRKVGDQEARAENCGAQLIVNEARWLVISKKPQFETGSLHCRSETLLDHTVQIWIAELHGHEPGAAFYDFPRQFVVSLPSREGEFEAEHVVLFRSEVVQLLWLKLRVKPCIS